MVRVSADKGTTMICKNTKAYIQKEENLLNGIDVKILQKTEKQLVKRTHKRLIDAFESIR